MQKPPLPKGRAEFFSSPTPRLPAAAKPASAILQPSFLPKKPCPDFVGIVLFPRPHRKASFPCYRENKTRSYRCGLLLSRDDKIRTCDPLHPMQVRYRAALRPETGTGQNPAQGRNSFRWGAKVREKSSKSAQSALTFF